MVMMLYCAYRFCRHADENKRQKVALILDKLITMTIEEVEACIVICFSEPCNLFLITERL